MSGHLNLMRLYESSQAEPQGTEEESRVIQLRMLPN